MADELELELETEPEETATSTETETTPDTTATQEPETATDGAGTETETKDKGDEEDDASLLAYVKEKYGEDLTGKYADDDAMIRGLVEAQKLVGRRNEEAEAWRQFQKAIAGRERDLQAFLDGKQAEPAKEPPKNGEPPEYNPAWRYQITQDANGNWVPAQGAPKDVVEKYRTYLAWKDAQLDAIVRDPQQFLGDLLNRKSQELEERAKQALDQRLAVQAEQMQVSNWFTANKGLLYTQDGKETTVHARAKTLYQTELEGMPDGVKKYQTALRLALAEQPKSPVKKPSPHATRKTPVSVHPEEKTLDDYLKDSDNPSEAFMRFYAERQKAGAKRI